MLFRAARRDEAAAVGCRRHCRLPHTPPIAAAALACYTPALRRRLSAYTMLTFQRTRATLRFGSVDAAAPAAAAARYAMRRAAACFAFTRLFITFRHSWR